LTDAFMCQECGIAWMEWALWLAHPSALLAISMRSAKGAAAQGDAAAFANDVLKIALSFSASASVIMSSLTTSDVYRGFSAQTKGRLRLFSDVTQSGETTWSSSADCLFGRVLLLDELLMLSLATPGIVVAAATLVLGIICFVRRWQGTDSSFVKDLMTLGLVSGNQYLPGVAAACVIAFPCYHTQTEEAGGNFLMAYSTSERCGERMQHMAVRAPVLALAFAAGPVVWSWLIQRYHGDGRSQLLRFLTASYRQESRGWEANRLAKNMLLTCAVAVAPISYCAGLQLFLVVCLMFSFTAWHLWNCPYRFAVLNAVEAISLCVLNLCMMASSLVVSDSWYVTRVLAGRLIFAAYGLLTMNFLGLAWLFLWAKFKLDDDHELFKT